MKKDFYSIRINTLRGDDPVPFDTYVLVGERFIHYTRINDELEGERLKNLKKKGVKKLFINSTDEDQYLSYLEVGLSSLSNASVSIDDRASLAHETMVTSVENAEKNLESESGYISQKRQLEEVSKFIGSDRGPIKSMLSAAGISFDNNQHSATVASLSLALATKLDRLESDEVTELGFAALLHDIGKSRLKFDLSIPVAKMTSDQLKQYKNHPLDGVSMLSGKPFISPRILGLIASHEEYGIGRGFPDKKNLFKMDLSYQILNMVNKFDHFCMEGSILPQQAVDPFFDKYSDHFDEELVNTFATILT